MGWVTGMVEGRVGLAGGGVDPARLDRGTARSLVKYPPM